MWQKTIKIVKYSGFNRTKTNEQISIEHKKSLVDELHHTIIEFTCSPQYEREWVQGYLMLTQRIIAPIDGITMTDGVIRWDKTFPNTIEFKTKASKPSPLAISALFQLTSQFQEAAILYKNTGTTESAAFASPKEILWHAEDISPLGALYKAIGKSINTPKSAQHPSIALLSGKIDLDLIKAIHATGVHIIVSRSAPTNLAVDFANSNAITLVGFARGTRFSIYSDVNYLR